jgi:hypothetical protein
MPRQPVRKDALSRERQIQTLPLDKEKRQRAKKISRWNRVRT